MINERYIKVYELFQKGLKQVEIARILGVSPTRISEMNARNKRMLARRKESESLMFYLYKLEFNRNIREIGL